VAEHTQAEFTHGICPDCLENHIKVQLETLQKMKDGKNGKIP